MNLLLDNNILFYAVLKQNNVSLLRIKLAKHKIYILLLKKANKYKHVNNIFFSSKKWISH